MICRVCGCSDEMACEFGCFWVEDGLCSICVDVEKLNNLFDFLEEEMKIKFNKEEKENIIEMWNYGDFDGE